MSKPLESSEKDTTICNLCRRQFAKYSCPTCNIPYCCLVCFRSSAHNQCSESFYKREVESDIHSRSSKNANERLKTLELLRRFEEEKANDLPLDEVDSDDDDLSDVAQRFGGLNLDSLSSDAIWSMLTPAEQKKFSKAMENPESELAQELLASEQLAKDIDEPWWEASDDLLDPSNIHHPKPKMLHLPSSMLKANASPYLLYNTFAICVAYAFVTRHLGTSPLSKLELGDPEYHDGRQLFSRLLPFVTDRKSAKTYENLFDLTTDLWSRFDLDEMTNKLFTLILQDAAALLTSFRVTEVTSTSATGGLPDLSSHAHKIPLLVLSDLYAFYSKGTGGDSNHIARKLLFYAAYTATIPTSFLEALSKEARIRAKHHEGFHG